MLKPLLFAIALLASPSVALAQAWPAKALRIVVPFPPGGGTDIGTRILAQSTPVELAAILAQDIAKYARLIKESGYKPE